MDGILNICKPLGPTSHDIVNRVRRLSGQRRVGHAGTLDPAAAGVLLVCLGQATRVIEYMANYDKEYLAEIMLGQTTDTYDAAGRPTSAAIVPQFSREQVAAALASFVGTIWQVPPAYSAIKQAGQPLYRLARAGKEVQIPARQVEVHSIDLLEWDTPTLCALIRCGKGTYIRSLAHDLGQKLGSGGHLRSLVRTASGRFHIRDAVTLEELELAFANGYAEDLIFPLDEALLHLPAVILGPHSVPNIQQGKSWQGTRPVAESQRCRAYTGDGEMVALLENDQGTALWHPRKVFAVGR
ncbi:MAG: tRNA pseudouridine(55) synthase TruB [Chloroflexota bacterium]